MTAAASTIVPTRNARGNVGRKRKSVDTKTYSGRFANRIRDLRAAADLDVATVAKRMTRSGYPVARSTIFAWENNTNTPPLDALPYLAKALRTTVADLFPAE